MKNIRSIRILSVALSLLMVIGMVCISRGTVSADVDTATGLKYTISGGKATITGFTAPAGFSGDLTIPGVLGEAPVTSIRNGAFFENGDLTSVVIPSSVTNIGDGAFYSCENLANVTIPNGVTSIGIASFFGCTDLTNITIPSSVNSIGLGVFSSCDNLISISVETANLTFKSADGVLYSKDGTQLIAFPGGKSGSFTIPESVTSIGGSTFSGCIGLTGITIPGSVSIIEPGAFSASGNILSISVNTANPNYKSIDGVLYSKDGTQLIAFPGGKSGSFIIPNSVMSIESSAFLGCIGLTSVVIPNSVTNVDMSAFYGCTGLTSITIPNSVTSIGEYAFTDCKSLTSITIPNSVTSIGEYAFSDCSNLISAYFHGNAPTMGQDVFINCATGFTVYYANTANNYTNPWNGYPTASFIPTPTPTPVPPTPTPTTTPDPTAPTVSYQTHVQDIGWQGYVSNGRASGTSAQSKRLEAIKMKISLPDISGGIEYRTHVQDIGWQGWVANDQLSGTSGQSKRLEAIQIRLTGDAANAYDVYYRVHAQNVGWMGWAKNGESSGTAGHSYRLEAIEIKLVEKGGTAPGTTAWRFIDKYEPTNTVQYKTHVQDIGWQDYVRNGVTSGTSGQSKRLEGIQIKLNNIEGGIEYRTHVQDYGWMAWASNDAMSGTSGQSKRLEAIQIRLTGEAADIYDIYYCVHAQNMGWLDWAKNGQSAGTAGFGYRLEAIQIVLVPKGGPAPGMTARAFVQG